MQKIPTPQEMAAAQKQNELLSDKNTPFIQRYDKLTEKQKKLMMLVLTRPDLADIEKVKEAGYNVTTTTKASGFLKKISGSLGDALLQLSVTEGDLARTIQENLKAMEHHVYRYKTKDDDGKVSYKTEIVETPNYEVRLRTVALLMKHGNYFPAQKVKGEFVHTFTQQTAAVALLKKRNETIEDGSIPADYEVMDEAGIN